MASGSFLDPEAICCPQNRPLRRFWRVPAGRKPGKPCDPQAEYAAHGGEEWTHALLEAIHAAHGIPSSWPPDHMHEPAVAPSTEREWPQSCCGSGHAFVRSCKCAPIATNESSISVPI